LARNNENDLRDGIGDMVVTLIILAMQNNMDLYLMSQPYHRYHLLGRFRCFLPMQHQLLRLPQSLLAFAFRYKKELESIHSKLKRELDFGEEF
jgi:hypothetical protein